MSETRRGQCHCGAIEIAVSGPIDFVLECNCSICTKKAMLHWIVSADRFELVRGQDRLTCYQFGSKAAKHYFCGVCGISPFYVPRSHPDMFDVNLRCIDSVDLEAIERRPFDGRDWETARVELGDLGGAQG